MEGNVHWAEGGGKCARAEAGAVAGRVVATRVGTASGRNQAVYFGWCKCWGVAGGDGHGRKWRKMLDTMRVAAWRRGRRAAGAVWSKMSRPRSNLAISARPRGGTLFMNRCVNCEKATPATSIAPLEHPRPPPPPPHAPVPFCIHPASPVPWRHLQEPAPTRSRLASSS